MRTLHKTGALCPKCLKELPAEVYADDEGMRWMTRASSREHQQARHAHVALRQTHALQWLLSEAFEKTKPQNTIPVTDKCPFGCGTCARHERRGTLLEIEVTRNCNLHCPVCFMSA